MNASGCGGRAGACMGIRALRGRNVPVEAMPLPDPSQGFSGCLQLGANSHTDFKTEETAWSWMIQRNQEPWDVPVQWECTVAQHCGQASDSWSHTHFRDMSSAWQHKRAAGPWLQQCQAVLGLGGVGRGSVPLQGSGTSCPAQVSRVCVALSTEMWYISADGEPSIHLNHPICVLQNSSQCYPVSPNCV